MTAIRFLLLISRSESLALGRQSHVFYNDVRREPRYPVLGLRPLSDVVSMLAHRQRRWANIKTTSGRDEMNYVKVLFHTTVNKSSETPFLFYVGGGISRQYLIHFMIRKTMVIRIKELTSIFRIYVRKLKLTGAVKSVHDI